VTFSLHAVQMLAGAHIFLFLEELSLNLVASSHMVNMPVLSLSVVIQLFCVSSAEFVLLSKSMSDVNRSVDGLF
jgi:hypothetical protein